MKIIKTNAESHLQETVKALEEYHSAWRAQIYALSQVEIDENRKAFEGLLLGLVIHYLPNTTGYVFVTRQKNIIVLGQSVSDKSFNHLLHSFTGHLPPELRANLPEGAIRTFDFNTTDGWSDFLAFSEKETRGVAKSPPVKKSNQIPSTTPTSASSTTTNEAFQKLFQKNLSERQSREKPCILLVEDDPVSLLMARKALDNTFNVQTATSGSEARAAYVTHAPDVVFLDIGLPDASGHDVLSSLIALDQDAYVVMLSGNSFQSDIVKAVKSGAKGFVGKPFARAKLLHYIAQSPHCAHSLAPSRQL